MTRLLALALAVAALGLPGAARAGTAPPLYIVGPLDTPGFLVQPVFDGVAPPLVGISLVAAGAERWPSRVVVAAPPGYVLDTGLPAGTSIGWGVLALAEDPLDVPLVSGGASLEVRDAAEYGDDPGVQACAPGQHAAVWLLRVAGDGLELEVPLFIDPEATGFRITYCLPDLRSLGGSIFIVGFSIRGAVALPGRPAATPGPRGSLRSARPSTIYARSSSCRTD